MTTRPTRTSINVLVAVMLAVAAGHGVYYYAPWTRFVDTTVNDELATGVAPNSRTARPGDQTRTSAPQPYRVLSGTFVSHQHRTTGTGRIVKEPACRGTSNRITLELIDLDTANGPDLQVWLSNQPVTGGRSGWKVFDTGGRVELDGLKGNKGNQVYEIPATANLAAVRSVIIWSGRFPVSYGAAALS